MAIVSTFSIWEYEQTVGGALREARWLHYAFGFADFPRPVAESMLPSSTAAGRILKSPGSPIIGGYPRATASSKGRGPNTHETLKAEKTV
jgi:hypothetical protein